MSFQRLINKGRQNVSRFFNSTLPSASRQGVRYLNSTIIPFARQVHGVGRAISQEVTTNETIPEHIRKKAKKASDFSDLGLSRLENVQGGINRVAGQLGLE